MPLIAALKHRLRPLVFSARQVARRLERVVRPPVPWDGNHDPALLRFPPWSGEADGLHLHDFLGIRTATHFRHQIRPDPAGPLQTAYPPPHAAYFEIAFVLDSILRADPGRRFSMLELGAGYGPWLVMAHRAVQLSERRPVRLVGVEMNPEHFRFLHEHFRNNGIDPADHTLIHGAVSDYDGEAIYHPEVDPRLSFGQSIARRRPGSAPVGGERPAAPRVLDAAHEAVRVPCFHLSRLIGERGPFDLVHVDIQGEELRALRGALPELNAGADRLLVGTHSRRIHRALRGLFRDAGWETVYDFRCGARERTRFGDVQFLDGLLALVNYSASRSS